MYQNVKRTCKAYIAIVFGPLDPSTRIRIRSIIQDSSVSIVNTCMRHQACEKRSALKVSGFDRPHDSKFFPDSKPPTLFAVVVVLA